MIEDGLFTALKNHSGAGNKVKEGSIYHIYPLVLPEGLVLTNGYAITYTEINQQVTVEAKASTFQINAFGMTFEKARLLAADVEDCLNELRNTLMGTFAIVYAKIATRQALYDDQSKLWYFAIDIIIKY